jgi:uncharacterized protein YceK
MRVIAITAFVIFLNGCMTVDQIKASKGVYCSGVYKGMRAVGRTALSATTGVVMSDVCDTIDDIISEDADGGTDGNNSGD